MLTKNDPTSAVVENWLADFEQALPAPNDADLRALFRPDCHWRDVLALTWTIQTLGGRDAVVSALKQWAAVPGIVADDQLLAALRRSRRMRVW